MLITTWEVLIKTVMKCVYHVTNFASTSITASRTATPCPSPNSSSAKPVKPVLRVLIFIYRLPRNQHTLMSNIPKQARDVLDGRTSQRTLTAANHQGCLRLDGFVPAIKVSVCGWLIVRLGVVLRRTVAGCD